MIFVLQLPTQFTIQPKKACREDAVASVDVADNLFASLFLAIYTLYGLGNLPMPFMETNAKAVIFVIHHSQESSNHWLRQ